MSMGDLRGVYFIGPTTICLKAHVFFLEDYKETSIFPSFKEASV